MPYFREGVQRQTHLFLEIIVAGGGEADTHHPGSLEGCLVDGLVPIHCLAEFRDV
jgi:hypothetical protein